MKIDIFVIAEARLQLRVLGDLRPQRLDGAHLRQLFVARIVDLTHGANAQEPRYRTPPDALAYQRRPLPEPRWCRP